MTLDGLVECKPGGKKSDFLVEIENRMVLLPPAAGGLIEGMLAGDATPSEDGREDVADQWLDENDSPRRRRVWDKEPAPEGNPCFPPMKIGGPLKGEAADVGAGIGRARPGCCHGGAAFPADT